MEELDLAGAVTIIYGIILAYMFTYAIYTAIQDRRTAEERRSARAHRRDNR